MSKQKDGGSVFPMIDSDMNTAGERYYFPTGGMSLRDWFAGQALTGLLAGDGKRDQGLTDMIMLTFKIADAMITQREKLNDA